MKVCKFGGTSVASAEQIKKVAKIVTSDPTEKLLLSLHLANGSVKMKK